MPTWRRRAVLTGGALLVVGWTKGAPYLASLRLGDLAFRDLPDLPPFRELISSGALSTEGAIFAGLADSPPADPAILSLRQSVRDDPWTALYGQSHAPAVPIAVFSDFRCPNCRVMDVRLSDIAAEDPAAIRIVRHELPIFGAASVTASRAVLGAKLQGAYREMHDRLIHTPAVTDQAYIRHLAQEMGIDPDRLMRDMQSDPVTTTLRHSRAVADVFGFIGTPAFAIGHTAFMGTVPTSVLRSLIEAEREVL
ncbi:Protein-disulfide isomerase [Loktanella atrilutea]|uniref:Protein-disulfide isomerase n=1 Tax=Loktanella atrilutea TaxID=366533 RepID=A0A1M5EVV7_LOKAT|nr:DsbA family protein [Loktanella atrilutea]SHF83354.1 Protein-disulfide isomerase [Loktanella atrilutea]